MLRVVAETLQHRGTQGWLVGGTVRDRELGRFSPDLDVVVADDPKLVAAQVAARLQRPWFALSKHFDAYRVLGEGGHIDIAALRGGGLVADLELRDFTVNAMAVPVEGGEPVDPFGGMRHLRERTLAAVSDSVFDDDPLRLMRAARFCHVLGFRLGPGLDTLVRAKAGALVRSARERVLTEMSLTLEVGRAAEAVGLWHELGLLDPLLPELTRGTIPVPAAGASAAGAPARHARAHSMVEDTVATLRQIDSVLADIATWFPAQAEVLSERLSEHADGALSRPVAVRLAGLLRLLPPERSEAVCRRLRLPNSVAGFVRRAAEERAREWETATLRFGAADVPSEREVVSFLWRSAPWEPEVIIVGLGADLAACSDSEANQDREAVEGARASAGRLMERWAARASGIPRPPVSGDELMSTLDLAPGPLLGQVAREVQLAWESAEVDSAEDALAAARVFLAEARRAGASPGL